jgi:peptidoglycan/xylan/chitin deacetylase (PgdA/CDA1 family)/sulfur carrier protein ThiS
MNPSLPVPKTLKATALAFLVALPLLAITAGDDLSLRVPVQVEGRTVVLTAGTRLGQALDLLGLSPQKGDLVDVEGVVLERGAYPGRVLLNGEPASPLTVLEPGDRIQVIDGPDQEEPVVRDIIPVLGGQPGNPQFFLATTAGKQVITSGKLSGKLASASFVPEEGGMIPPAVALTFDDGPSPMWTPQILEVLEEFEVPATFFVVGSLAERHPGLIRREVRVGMAVASHSYGHPLSPPFEELPPKRMREEIRKGRDVLTEMGLRVGLFRPPNGSYSQAVIRQAHRFGMRLVLWNVDPEDWRRGITSEAIVRGVLDNVRPGSIIVLHDGGGDRSATVEALPAIIRGIRQMGLKLVAIGARKP